MIILIILGVLAAVLSLAVTYYLYCMPQANIAEKLGNNDIWMAYVPFTRNVQRMNMVNMPMWKLFFVGGFFTTLFSLGVIALITWLFVAINPMLGAIIAIILGIAYIVFYLISTYDYNCRIAEKFCFRKVPTALALMFVPVLSQVIMCLLALSDRFYPAPVNSSSNFGNSNSDNGNFSSGGYVQPNPSDIGLFGIAGMYEGAKFTMKPSDEFVIGRDGALANIIISSSGDKVSRRHCSVKFNSVTCRYEVTDFSTNGTFYNNERLIKGQITDIPRGTTIIIGDKLNQFKLM